MNLTSCMVSWYVNHYTTEDCLVSLYVHIVSRDDIYIRQSPSIGKLYNRSFSKRLWQKCANNTLKLNYEIKTWINKYNKCPFDIFGEPYKIAKNIIYQVKYLTEIKGTLINLQTNNPSQTVIGKLFAKPLAKGFRKSSNSWAESSTGSWDVLWLETLQIKAALKKKRLALISQLQGLETLRHLLTH